MKKRNKFFRHNHWDEEIKQWVALGAIMNALTSCLQLADHRCRECLKFVPTADREKFTRYWQWHIDPESEAALWKWECRPSEPPRDLCWECFDESDEICPNCFQIHN